MAYWLYGSKFERKQNGYDLRPVPARVLVLREGVKYETRWTRVRSATTHRATRPDMMRICCLVIFGMSRKASGYYFIIGKWRSQKMCGLGISSSGCMEFTNIVRSLERSCGHTLLQYDRCSSNGVCKPFFINPFCVSVLLFFEWLI